MGPNRILVRCQRKYLEWKLWENTSYMWWVGWPIKKNWKQITTGVKGKREQKIAEVSNEIMNRQLSILFTVGKKQKEDILHTKKLIQNDSEK